MDKNRKTVFYCLLPVSLLLIAVVLVPVIFALFISFYQWDLSAGTQISYIGISNYIENFQDKYFWQAVGRSLLFIVSTVPIEAIVGLLIALLLHREIVGGRIWRVLLTVPMMITPVVIATLWKIIYNAEFGVLNWLVSFGGVSSKCWLGDPVLAFFSLALVEIWHNTPFFILLLLAGLQTIPHEIYEAAKIDSVSGWQTFFYITLPYLKNTILLGGIFRMVDVFRVFDIVLPLTNGGPGRSTEFVSLYAYTASFRVFKLSMAASQGFILLLLTLVISLPLLFCLARSRAGQEG